MTETTAPTTKRKFKSKKKLTLATFKLEKGTTLYLLIVDAIHRGKQRGTPKKRPDGTDEDPPLLAHVINMDTGEHGQIMCASIIHTELSETYPNDSYVGKAFGITRGERKPGKRYDPYEIEEIEIPEEMKEAATNAVAEFAAAKQKEADEAAKKKEADEKAASENTAPATDVPPVTPPAASSRRR